MPEEYQLNFEQYKIQIQNASLSVLRRVKTELSGCIEDCEKINTLKESVLSTYLIKIYSDILQPIADELEKREKIEQETILQWHKEYYSTLQLPNLLEERNRLKTECDANHEMAESARLAKIENKPWHNATEKEYEDEAETIGKLLKIIDEEIERRKR